MGGIVLQLALMFWGGEEGDVETRPVSEDVRAAGLAAISRWLEVSGIRTGVLRRRFTVLVDHDQGADGNLLIVHVPMVLVAESDEITALRAWVAAGNTLVVSASLMESPAWHLTGGSVMRTTEQITGLALELEGAPSTSPDGEESLSILEVPGWVAISGSSRTQSLRAVADHPLGQGFDGVEVPWDGTWVKHRNGAESTLSNDDGEAPGTHRAAAHAALQTAHAAQNDDAWTPALEHAGTRQTVVWERQLGRGHIVVQGHPSLLGNAAIHERGNRRFVMNLVANYLGPEGWVIFDDAHQGVNDLYTPDDLLTDVRVLHTLGLLLVCWAVYVLADAGSWERATRERPRSRSGQADLVRASGNYLARRLHHHALANGLLAPLRERLADKWGLPADQALEKGLELEQFSHARADEIKRRLTSSATSRANAIELHNLILGLRRDIS